MLSPPSQAASSDSGIWPPRVSRCWAPNRSALADWTTHTPRSVATAASMPPFVERQQPALGAPARPPTSVRGACRGAAGAHLDRLGTAAAGLVAGAGAGQQLQRPAVVGGARIWPGPAAIATGLPGARRRAGRGSRSACETPGVSTSWMPKAAAAAPDRRRPAAGPGRRACPAWRTETARPRSPAPPPAAERWQQRQRRRGETPPQSASRRPDGAASKVERDRRRACGRRGRG